MKDQTEASCLAICYAVKYASAELAYYPYILDHWETRKLAFGLATPPLKIVLYECLLYCRSHNLS